MNVKPLTDRQDIWYDGGAEDNSAKGRKIINQTKTNEKTKIRNNPPMAGRRKRIKRNEQNLPLNGGGSMDGVLHNKF